MAKTRRFKNGSAVKRRCLNFRAANEALDLSVAPVLIPEAVYKTLAEEGSYEFVEHIKAPTEGDGGIYTPEFFESYINVLADRPIPGSKRGHIDTPDSDFYTVGGMVNKTGEGADVYLRILVPPTDYDGKSNAGLVRDVKAKIAQFSLIVDAEPERGADGKSYVTKTLGGERNDRVDYGAMEQELLANKKEGDDKPPDESEIMALIEAGAIDTESESDTLVKNGKVHRLAAVKLQSTADKALAGRVLNAIAVKLKSLEKEKNQVTKQEIIEAAKAAITNNELTLEELAEALKMENKLKNATDEQRAKLAEAIAGALELPPETSVEELLKAAKAAFDEAKEASEAAAEVEAAELANGKKLKNSKGEETDNPAYIYAKNQLRGLRGERLKNAKEALKKDIVLQSLVSQNADPRTAAYSGGGGNPDYSAVGMEV
jgi:transcriptional regulator with XRE-family HTH domain